MKKTLLAAALASLIAQPAIAADKPELVVMTYESFVSEWGPGPAVEAAFEKECNCDLNFISAGDGAALLARIKLEGARSDADIVLGLDTNLTAAAAQTGLFAEHAQTLGDSALPVAWQDPYFLPFDWGYFAFVYDKNRISEPPASFEDLIAAPEDLRIVIQDPRSSTPGLGLLLWVKAAYGDRASEIWSGLAPRILTVTKGWSEAYGMFLEGEADMVLSYTTSPAYHIVADEDNSKAAATFSEGHYMQIEVAGKLAGSDQPELADQFLRFMTSDTFQSIIPTTNWMYPVKTPSAGLPEGFTNPVAPENALLIAPDEAVAARKAALAEWQEALSQ